MSSIGPYLLDTHVWLWYVAGSERLPARLRAAIDATSGHLWFSPISAWEIVMLHARGRIELTGGPRSWVETALARFPLQEATSSSRVSYR